MATVQETIPRLTIVATRQGVNEATASLNQLAQAQQNVAVVGQRTEHATLSQEKRFEALERYVDTMRAQAEFEKVQKLVNATVAQNPALQERANVVLASAQERYETITKAANDNTAAHARMQGGIRGILEAVTKGGGAESAFKGIATAVTSMLGPLGSVAVAIGIVDLAAIAPGCQGS
jgi:3,4-dihydroxy-2-butanone 4-phosphate synthase